MTWVIDEEKWLKAIADEELPSVPLAVPAHVRVTLRKRPEVSADQLVRVAGVVAEHLDRLDREVGGPGVSYDPEYIVDHPDRLTYPVYLLPVGDIFGRAQHLGKMLDEVVEQAGREVAAGRDTGLAERVEALSARGVAERLVSAGA